MSSPKIPPCLQYSSSEFLALRKMPDRSNKRLPPDIYKALKDVGLLRFRGRCAGCHIKAPRSDAKPDSTETSVDTSNKSLLVCDYIISNDIDVIFLTETWLGTDDQVTINEVTPAGYTFFNIPRHTDRHGGIAAVCKSKLNLKLVSVTFDVSTFGNSVRISDCKKNIHYIIIYRPPPSERNQFKTSTFLANFDNLLNSANVLPGKLLILGDFNIHFDCPEKHDAVNVRSSLNAF